MDSVEKRRRWMIRRRLDGWKIPEITEALRVSEKTVDRWCSVYRKYGREGLRVKSRAENLGTSRWLDLIKQIDKTVPPPIPSLRRHKGRNEDFCSKEDKHEK
jgi:transposase